MAQTPEQIKVSRSSFEDLKRQFADLDNLSTNLMQLQRQQQILYLQADSLAKDIQRRKQQAPSLLPRLSLFWLIKENRGLGAALRFSQTLADSLQTLQAREQRIDLSLRQKAEGLLKSLSGDIARLVKQGEELKRSKNVSQRERESVARELVQCREWQRRCQEWLEQPPPAIIIYQVEAQPEDTPETLRRKADFLHDQSDRLRREVKRLDAKIAEIRDETQVRRRVADLAADLSLLDPNREGVSSPAREPANVSSFSGPGRGAEDLNTQAASTAQLPIYQNWPAPLGDLSVDDLERWCARLEQQKKQRQMQADSLAQRALEMEKQSNRQDKPERENRQ